jgi:hypothetical protein
MKYLALLGLAVAAAFSSGASAQSGTSSVRDGAANSPQIVSAATVSASASTQPDERNPFKTGDFSEARLPDGAIVQRP